MMNYRIPLCTLILLLVVFGVVEAKLAESDKAAIVAQLEKYKDDPARLTLVLAVADSTMDFSDEPDLRQQITNTAGAAGLDMSQYPNIAQGTVPYVVQQKEIEAAGSGLPGGSALQQGEAQIAGAPNVGAPEAGVQPGQEQQAVQPPSPVQQVQPVSSSGYSAGMIVTLLVIAAILVLVGWLYSKRKK